MAFTYNPTKVPSYDVEIVREGSKKPDRYEIPLMGYVPKEVHEAVDKEITERVFEVQKLRDERNAARLPIPESDRSTQYPRQIEVLQRLLERLAPELAAETKNWPVGPLEDLWEDWEKASKPVDSAKSEASSTSSAKTE